MYVGQVSGVIWADSPRLCALTLGTPAALVVNIGAKEAEVAAGKCLLVVLSTEDISTRSGRSVL